MEVFIRNTEEMDSFAREILQSITKKRQQNHEANTVIGACVIGLSGELGAGKTAFAKSFARALSILEPIPSPTFVLARFYNIAQSHDFTRLVHIDAYRIEETSELAVLDWAGLQVDAKNIILVEWPENMKELFPVHADTIFFEVENETTRKVRTNLT